MDADHEAVVDDVVLEHEVAVIPDGLMQLLEQLVRNVDFEVVVEEVLVLARDRGVPA